jgi:hypothetical protein
MPRIAKARHFSSRNLRFWTHSRHNGDREAAPRAQNVGERNFARLILTHADF